VAGATSKASAQAVQAWADYTNSHGGSAAHPAQVIVKDNQDSPANSLADVTEMIQNDHVVAIVGEHDSGLESAPCAGQHGGRLPVPGRRLHQDAVAGGGSCGADGR
jgi:branched-chain amino acid transport system substrate-binding protein